MEWTHEEIKEWWLKVLVDQTIFEERDIKKALDDYFDAILKQEQNCEENGHFHFLYSEKEGYICTRCGKIISNEKDSNK